MKIIADYALLNDEIEFSRYYELREDEEGTQYICDMSERTFEHICMKTLQVLLVFNHEGHDYVITVDSEDTYYLDEYVLLGDGKIEELLQVEEQLRETHWLRCIGKSIVGAKKTRTLRIVNMVCMRR